jgi:hypothetical protein
MQDDVPQSYFEGLLNVKDFVELSPARQPDGGFLDHFSSLREPDVGRG